MSQSIKLTPSSKNDTLLSLFDSSLLRQTTIARQTLRAASSLFSKRMINQDKSSTENINKIINQVRARILETLDVLDFDDSQEKKSH